MCLQLPVAAQASGRCAYFAQARGLCDEAFAQARGHHPNLGALPDVVAAIEANSGKKSVLYFLICAAWSCDGGLNHRARVAASRFPTVNILAVGVGGQAGGLAHTQIAVLQNFGERQMVVHPGAKAVWSAVEWNAFSRGVWFTPGPKLRVPRCNAIHFPILAIGRRSKGRGKRARQSISGDNGHGSDRCLRRSQARRTSVTHVRLKLGQARRLSYELATLN